MVAINHWGKWIDSTSPVTGVVSIHSVAWINQEVDQNSIDLSWEFYRAQWFADKLADFQHRNGYDRVPSKSTARRWEVEFSRESEFYSADEPQYLIGQWLKAGEANYFPDPAGEYAAIVSYDRFMCVQVVHSTYVRYSAVCSPCFPGQCDLDNAGQYLAFDLPPDLYGTGEDYRGQNPNAPLRWDVNNQRVVEVEAAQ